MLRFAAITESARFNTPEAYQYYKWRDLFLQEAKEHLSGKSNKNGSIVDKEKIKELERIIGKQTVTIVPLTAGQKKFKNYRITERKDYDTKTARFHHNSYMPSTEHHQEFLLSKKSICFRFNEEEI